MAGDPAVARGSRRAARARRPGRRAGEDRAAGLGWLAGVALLWLSKTWTVRDKLLGTLVVPGGLLPATYLTLTSVTVETCSTLHGVQHCTGGISTAQRVVLITLWLVLVAAPIATAFHLGRQIRSR